MSNNAIILDGCITRFKNDNQLELNDGETFELFSISQITKNEDITHENIQNSIVDGSLDGGIDSLLIFVNDDIVESLDQLEDIKISNKTTSKFIIAQCKKENSFKESTIDKLITSIPILFDLGIDENDLLTRFNSNVVEKASIIRKVWQETVSSGGKIQIEYWYSCNAENIRINAAFVSKIEQLEILSKKLFFTEDVVYKNFSSEELLKFYQTQKTNRLSIIFKEQPLSTSYNTSGLGYVGTVKLFDYKNLITDENGNIREHLFESNIRHYQGEQVDVNKKIKQTIETIGTQDFWWLNNGVTIIAENPNQVNKTLSLNNIQIVNGLQTSYSIFNTYNGSASDERSVLVKVIINDDKETIDNIIASTNSQNPVSATLLRATEETQRNIELYFLNENYYYDRRKNYYKNQGKPSTKIFSIQFTAQSIESIIFNNPHTARAKPTSLIKEDSTYHRIFNPSKDFKGYLNCCLINKMTNDYWLQITDPINKSMSSNFKLHLARIVASELCNKSNYTYNDIVNIDLDTYDSNVFAAALTQLLVSITQYQAENQQSNLINMAKSSGFTDKLSEIILEKFST